MIDLQELSRKLDESLANETPESLKLWLREKEFEETIEKGRTMEAIEKARRCIEMLFGGSVNGIETQLTELVQTIRKEAIEDVFEHVVIVCIASPHQRTLLNIAESDAEYFGIDKQATLRKIKEQTP